MLKGIFTLIKDPFSCLGDILACTSGFFLRQIGCAVVQNDPLHPQVREAELGTTVLVLMPRTTCTLGPLWEQQYKEGLSFRDGAHWSVRWFCLT